MATILKLGLVTIPLMLVNTTNNSEKRVSLNQIHLADRGRVGYRYYCKSCNKELTRDEIGKMYKNKVLSDEQLENIKSFNESNTIEVIGIKKIDVGAKKRFFYATYYLLPDISKTAKKVNQVNFKAFMTALIQSKLTAIGKFTSRGTQHLVLIYGDIDNRVLMSLIPFNDAINDDINRIEENLPEIEVKESLIEEAKEFINQFNSKVDLAKIKNDVKERYEQAISGNEEISVYVQASNEESVFKKAIKKTETKKVKVK